MTKSQKVYRDLFNKATDALVEASVTKAYPSMRKACKTRDMTAPEAAFIDAYMALPSREVNADDAARMLYKALQPTDLCIFQVVGRMAYNLHRQRRESRRRRQWPRY